MPDDRPEWLADRFLAAAATLDLPQVFETFERASAFAELRDWGSGEVRVFHVDGTYRVVPGNEPCGCDGAKEVDHETGIELDHDGHEAPEPGSFEVVPEALAGDILTATLARGPFV